MVPLKQWKMWIWSFLIAFATSGTIGYKNSNRLSERKVGKKIKSLLRRRKENE